MVMLLLTAVGSLVACAVFGSLAPTAIRTMSPRHAVLLVATGSVGLAVAAGSALAALGLALVARLAAIAADGHWSAQLVAAELPVPAWLGAVAAVVVAVLLIRAVVRTARILMRLVSAERACRTLSAAGGSRIVVVDDGSADAFTVAGIRGRVVISRGLLGRLSPDERRMVTAHELAHLHQRHHLYVHAAEIAAAANPLLAPVPAAVRLGIERWADEDAAQTLGDRQRAGRALARVAVLRHRLRGHRPVDGDGALTGIPLLGAADHRVICRVLALLAPAQEPRPGRTAVVAVIVGCLLAAGLVSLHNVYEIIEQAGVGNSAAVFPGG
jgi:Zn-dependent protease with chaperone function